MKNQNTKINAIIALATLTIAAGSQASIYFGDPLIARTYATDFPVGLGQTAPVIVLPAAVLPTGTLNSFATYDQVDPGGSPYASGGNFLTAYILRPTGNPNQFQEVFNSGLLSVPTVTSDQIVTFSVTPFQTLAGDRIAYYGQGVPVDITGAGTDILIYPAGSPPGLNDIFTLDTSGFPIYPQDRFYSFGANVTPVPEFSTILAGALLLLPFGAGAIRSMRKNVVA